MSEKHLDRASQKADLLVANQCEKTCTVVLSAFCVSGKERKLVG
jgi:hypothetical protein